MLRYKIDVDFDDQNIDVTSRRNYFDVIHKYDADTIGHEKTGTSTIFLSAERLNLRQLVKDLVNIPIISVKTL